LCLRCDLLDTLNGVYSGRKKDDERWKESQG
jgi:hypothetical protein